MHGRLHVLLFIPLWFKTCFTGETFVGKAKRRACHSRPETSVFKARKPQQKRTLEKDKREKIGTQFSSTQSSWESEKEAKGATFEIVFVRRKLIVHKVSWYLIRGSVDGYIFTILPSMDNNAHHLSPLHLCTLDEAAWHTQEENSSLFVIRVVLMRQFVPDDFVNEYPRG